MRIIHGFSYQQRFQFSPMRFNRFICKIKTEFLNNIHEMRKIGFEFIISFFFRHIVHFTITPRSHVRSTSKLSAHCMCYVHLNAEKNANEK